MYFCKENRTVLVYVSQAESVLSCSGLLEFCREQCEGITNQLEGTCSSTRDLDVDHLKLFQELRPPAVILWSRDAFCETGTHLHQASAQTLASFTPHTTQPPPRHGYALVWLWLQPAKIHAPGSGAARDNGANGCVLCNKEEPTASRKCRGARHYLKHLLDKADQPEIYGAPLFTGYAGNHHLILAVRLAALVSCVETICELCCCFAESGY